MSSANKHKSESSLDRSGLPGWLRRLADAVESGELPVEGGQAVSVEDFKCLKISVKENFGGGLSVRLGVKFPAAAGALPGEPGEDDAEDEGEGALPRYKSLKKHMKQTFRAIGAALAAGQLPPALEAASFIADSKLMVSYPGKGDEFYAEYLERTEAFEAALAAGDVQALTAHYHELNRLKRECHSRHA